MTEKSLLGELVALFDGVTDKLCPILAAQTLSLPSTFVKIEKAEKNAAVGTFDVTFHLIHRYRELDPSDAMRAFSYVERLCEGARETGKIGEVTLKGATTLADGATGECSAVLHYAASAAKCELTVGTLPLSTYILAASICDEGIIRESFYIERAEASRHRVGGECTVKLTLTCDGVAKICRLFASCPTSLVCSVGSLAVKGDFVLAELCADDVMTCSLRSSGEVTYGTVGEDGKFEKFA